MVTEEDRARFVSWASSVLVGISFGLVLHWLGAPRWASYGFGYLAFQAVTKRTDR